MKEDTIKRAFKKCPKGLVAEVGAGPISTPLICKENREIMIFDTFEGLPEPGPYDEPSLKKGAMKTKVPNIKNVYFIKGLFQDTKDIVEDKKFAFVHLDCDLYEPIKAGLEFFWPRMVKGGIILVHDITWSGPKKAVKEFPVKGKEIGDYYYRYDR